MPKKNNASSLNFWEAVATITGTIIGAGILGIPYVVSQSGFITGLIFMIFLGLATMLMNLFLGETILRTKGKFQLSGYAEKYLGDWGKKLMTVSMVVGIYGALVAYLIGEGEVIQALIGGNNVIYSLIFFAIFSFVLFIGIQLVKVFEFAMSLLIFLVVILIAFFSAPNISLSNFNFIDYSKVFLPYGVILFAYLGATSIYQAREILGKNSKQLKTAIITASAIPIFLYILFAFVVVGVTGLSTTEIATVGLGKALGNKMLYFGNIFSFFTMGTSFLALGLAMIQMYNYDYKIKKNLAWVMTICIPFFLFLIGARDFIKTLGIIGSLVGGIEGVLLIMIFWKAKIKGNRKPEYSFSKEFGYIIGSILFLVFVLGFLHTVFGLK